MHFVVRQRTEDWTAYVEGFAGTWECGKSEAEAIGNLIITLYRCWPQHGVRISGDPVYPIGATRP